MSDLRETAPPPPRQEPDPGSDGEAGVGAARAVAAAPPRWRRWPSWVPRPPGRLSRPALVLLAIIAGHLVLNVSWLRASNQIDGIDVSNHLLFQLELATALKTACARRPGVFACPQEIYRTVFRPVEHSTYYWPPLVYLVSLPFNWMLGQSLLSTKLGQLPFLVLLLVATYLLAARFFDRRCGVWSAFLVSMMPMIFQSSRQYALDLPLTAAVTWGTFALLRSEGFRNRRWSLIAGASLGLGMLIKGQALLFLGPLLCCSLVGRPPGGEPRRWRRVALNLALAGLLAGGIAGQWYLPQAGEVLGGLRTHMVVAAKAGDGPTGEVSRWSVTSLGWHAREIFQRSVGPLIAACCLAGVVILLRRRERRRLLLLYLAGLLPLLLFSVLFLVKHSRFLMPAFPVLAILGAGGIISLALPWRRWALGLVTVLSLVQFVLLSFVLPYRPADTLPVWANLLGGAEEYAFAPYRLDRSIFPVVRVLERVPPSAPGEPIHVGLLSDSRRDSPAGPFEMGFFLKLRNPALLTHSWIESPRHFMRHGPHLAYLIHDSSAGCPALRSLVQHLRSDLHGQRHRVKRLTVEGVEHQEQILRQLSWDADSFVLLYNFEDVAKEARHMCVYQRRRPAPYFVWIENQRDIRGYLALVTDPGQNYAASRYWVPFGGKDHQVPDPPQPLRTDQGPGARFTCRKPVCRFFLKIRPEWPPVQWQRRVFAPGSPIWIAVEPGSSLGLQVQLRGRGAVVHPHILADHTLRSLTRISAGTGSGEDDLVSYRLSQRLSRHTRAIGLVLDLMKEGTVDLRGVQLHLKPPRSDRSAIRPRR